LHHSLRGAEADGDADFVASVARDWVLGFTLERIDVVALAREKKLAVEEAARRARYAFLTRVAEQIGALTVAVGHTGDDQAETVLMHFIRGAGLAGLRGMLACSPLADYRLLEGEHPPESIQDIRLIRPLLEVTSVQVMEYCRYHGLEPRFDRSNLDTTYFRNWLRHAVLPLLMEHNPNIHATIRRSAKVLADDYQVLREQADRAWERVVVKEQVLESGVTPSPMGDARIVLDLEGWRALVTGLQRSVLREAVSRLRWTLRDISFLHVEQALRVGRHGTTGAKATLPGGLMMRVGYEHLIIGPRDVIGLGSRTSEWPLLQEGQSPVPVTVPGELSLAESGWLFEAQVLSREELPANWAENPDRWCAYVDGVLVRARLQLRPRAAGDRFQPLGMHGHSVKLGDFFTNQKVPNALRGRIPLIDSERGIIWVCGLRLDHRARVREDTEEVLRLTLRRS
jgi:tRNA(Ile)-lysidine synthase